jgi:hypothetical protein
MIKESEAKALLNSLSTAPSNPGWSALSKRGMTFLPYGLTAVVILTVIATLEHQYPVAYVYFIHEDGLVENSTAAAFALAAVLLLWESRRPGHFLRRTLLIAVAVAALFVAGEEISWGQRIFGFDTPETLAVVNDQGEINFHNIGGVNQLPKYRPLGGALLIALVASIALQLLRRRSPFIRALPLLQPALVPLVLLTIWMLLFLPFVRSDELGELLLGLCLLAWATNLALDRRAGSHRLVLAISLGALAGVLLLGAGLAAAFPPENPGWRLDRTAQIFARYGLYEQSQKILDYVRSDPEYVRAVNTGRVQCSRRLGRDQDFCR